MIRTIRGLVTRRLKDGIVIEANGIGYLITVPIRTQPSVGSDVYLFTYHHIREDIQALYGFISVEELQMFEALLTVSGIGPKIALAVMNVATPAQITQAVAADNLGFFQTVPGLGKKGAAKLIVELKGKLSKSGAVTIPTGGQDLAEALMALGYASHEIQTILGSVPPDLDLQAQVSWSLKALAR
ncbi:Holliday junction branch migration protein RuvA [Candidatus Berkelbacteria bacterium]|nr:Holliday junction branch migration protein RuvA [Candidatus Berkelbacteria bacterium]